ncbi:uncharacterized protein LOC144631078 isoform X2 [Oculina patagonica]
MCRIALKLVPVGLRKIFKQEWDFVYSKTLSGIWQDTAQNGSDFYHKETKRGKKITMNGRYLNIIRNGNTAEWDCSCLFAAILYSNTIGSTLSPTVMKNVDDLRQVRNDIAHITEDTLTDAQFQSYAGRVLTAFTSLGLPINEVEEVKNQTGFPTAEVEDLKKEIGDLKTELDQTKSELETTKNELQSTQDDLSAAKEENKVLTQEINSKVESFCSLTFTPPHEIIKRSSDLAKITKRMQDLNNGSNGAVSTIYLSGNPGCGKSQLARQIGEEFYGVKSRDTNGLIFVATLNAETLESLADSYITLARKLGITEYATTQMERSKRERTEETLKEAMCMVSKKIASFSNWLIIADNVIDLPLVRSYLPQTASKEWGHGQVLITTQDNNTIPSNAPHTYHESLHEGMQRVDAVELLKQVSQISNQEQAEKVAEVLEYQPLALAAAAFYVQTIVSGGSPDFSWTEYLETLRKGDREATEEILADQSVAYSNTMTTTVKMAIERSMKTSDVIRQTFCFLSLCASESITVEAVVRFVKARLGSPTLDELIRAKILKSSLIVSFCEEDGAPKYLRLHNIVHDVLKTLPLFESDFTQKLHCIATAINIFGSQLQKELLTAEYGHLELRRFTSHSKCLCRIAFSNSQNTAGLLKNLAPVITPDKVVFWFSVTAYACLKLSDLSEAKKLSELACDLHQYISIGTKGSLLRSHVFTTRGSVLSEVCDYKSALSYLQETLNIGKKLYGEEHGDVAKSYYNLGHVCRRIGQHDQAKEFYEKALNIMIKLYGEEHGYVAASYNNLGVVCSDIGQYDQAKEFDEKALNIRIKLYGEEHGDVAASYNNLGVVCSDIGQYDQAKEFDEKALNIRIKLYGEEHGDVAGSYNNLGVVCSDIGKNDQAKEFHEKALNIRIKLYGEEHGDVATSYNNLGVVCSDIGKYDQAKKFFEKALNIRIRLYGEEHGDVAASYNNLGVVCRSIGQHDQAKEFFQKELNIRIKLYGEEHGGVVASYNNLGVVCSDIGHFNEAKEFDEKALSIERNIYGEDHGHVADCYYNLAIDCHALGQYDKALEYHRSALSITKKIYGEEHGRVADGYSWLGITYRDIGEHDQSREFFKKERIIREKIFVAIDMLSCRTICRLVNKFSLEYVTIFQVKLSVNVDISLLISFFLEDSILGEHYSLRTRYRNIKVDLNKAR